MYLRLIDPFPSWVRALVLDTDRRAGLSILVTVVVEAMGMFSLAIDGVLICEDRLDGTARTKAGSCSFASSCDSVFKALTVSMKAGSLSFNLFKVSGDLGGERDRRLSEILKVRVRKISPIARLSRGVDASTGLPREVEPSEMIETRTSGPFCSLEGNMSMLYWRLFRASPTEGWSKPNRDPYLLISSSISSEKLRLWCKVRPKLGNTEEVAFSSVQL